MTCRHSAACFCVEEMRADRDAAIARAEAAAKKWQLYEHEYILPCFTWAEEAGIDLRALVAEAKGNCVDRLVHALIARAERAEREANVSKGRIISLRDQRQCLLADLATERAAREKAEAAVAALRDACISRSLGSPGGEMTKCRICGVFGWAGQWEHAPRCILARRVAGCLCDEIDPADAPCIVCKVHEDDAGSALLADLARLRAENERLRQHAGLTRWSTLASRLLAAVGVNPAREDGGTDDEVVATVEALVGRWRAIEAAAQTLPPEALVESLRVSVTLTWVAINMLGSPSQEEAFREIAAWSIAKTKALCAALDRKAGS